MYLNATGWLRRTHHIHRAVSVVYEVEVLEGVEFVGRTNTMIGSDATNMRGLLWLPV